MAPGGLLQLPISRHLLGRAFPEQVMEDAGEAGQAGAAVRHGARATIQGAVLGVNKWKHMVDLTTKFSCSTMRD